LVDLVKPVEDPGQHLVMLSNRFLQALQGLEGLKQIADRRPRHNSGNASQQPIRTPGQVV
jgi:hypothetical protein